MPKDSMMTTSHASLCALGEYLKRQCFFAPLREQVEVPQKTVRYRPIDKVLDGLLGILCGAKTISQSNGTIRLDPAVQRAFGFCQLVEANIVTRQIGTLPRSSLSLRQPAPCPSSRPNSQIGSSFLGGTPTRTANDVSVESVGQ